MIANEVFISIFIEYFDFADVFSLELASALFEYTKIKNHAIKLIEKQQPLNRSIYNLRLVKLETLKTYIEINLANGFIKHSKSLARALIFFDKKPDGNL